MTRSVPNSYATPVRPPEIVNAEAMRRGPLILAGMLAVASLAALALAIGATVNARRRDFAIYRAMGFTRRQVASSVRWQALTTVVVGVAIGIPAGVLIGRWTWRRYAGALGIALDVTTPLLLLGAVVVVATIAALIAAARPARIASRLRPAEILHTQ
jgi:putative ABC transport system permease protein